MLKRLPGMLPWMFMAAGILLLMAVPHSFFADGAQRYWALNLLTEGGVLSPIKYSMVGPLFALPLMGLGKLAGNEQGITSNFNILLLLAGMCTLFIALARRLAVPEVRSFLLILLFGSMMPVHALHFYGEMFTAVTVAAGTAAALLAGAYSGWVWTVLGAANTPMALVGFGFLALRQACSLKKYRYLLLPAAALGLILLEAKLRRGGFLISGYAGEHGKESVLPYTSRAGFGFPFAVGFLSLTLSFGKGIIFYAPGLLAVPAFLRSSADAAVRHLLELWLWFLLGILLVASTWYSWQGGWFWGPRFLMFASFPASLALAWQVHRARTFPACVITLLLLALSFWVGFSGLVFNQRDMALCLQDNARLEPLCWYTPEYSALWRPFVTGKIYGMNMFETGIALVWLGAFLCTAWPLFVQLSTLLPGRWANIRATLRPSHWRF